METNYKLNYQKSPPDSRDYIIKSISLTSSSTKSSLPVAVDLSKWCTPVKDQGNIGSCTAFAGSAMMEYFFKRNTGTGTTNTDFSEKFIYYATRVNVQGWPANEDSGCYLRDTLKCVTNYGAAQESSFPYLLDGQAQSNYSQSPPPSVYKEALNYKVSQYATIGSTNTPAALINLKTLLSNGSAFVGGIMCYSNFYNNVNGVIPNPSGSIIGGHAILFVGYDDSKQLFKFKNSWGTSWGDNGYGYLSYKYFTSGNVSEVWTVSQQKFNETLINVIIPSVPDTIFSARMNDLLILLSQSQDLRKITSQINSNPENSLISQSHVNELVNTANRIINIINDSKKKFLKNKLN